MKPSTAKDIALGYHQAHIHGQAFVAYRLPNTKKPVHFSGSISRTINDNESAFAFAPFSPDKKPYYIKETQSGAASYKKPLPASNTLQTSTLKRQFTDLVKSIKAAIKTGSYKKIVAARVLAINKPKGFDAVIIFNELCGQYKNAFITLVYIPGTGIWIGASPEILVAENDTQLTTYSLAGTKLIEDSAAWSAKEREEQKIVTDFIHKSLNKVAAGKIKINGPVTQNAERIKHILSVFTIARSDAGTWKNVVKALHPTPAVGGLPQKKAVEFIMANESFERTFYAGYLGPVNVNERTDLFVNLRCMEVRDKQLLFYAGCGITADSDPEKEWQESEEKIKVLKSLVEL